MAIYHLGAKVFSRSAGVSLMARVAYRSGTRIRDPETGKVYDYRLKKEVVHREIVLCDTAPTEYADRKKLWSAVQKQATRKDAQLAREIVLALPEELSQEKNLEIIRRFVRENFVQYGYIADICVHDKRDGNPHAHILITMRPIRDGRWSSRSSSRFKLDPTTGEKIPVIDKKTGMQKRRKDGRLCYERESVNTDDMDTREALMRWRTSWADICNRELEKIGIEAISEKSYAERGINLEPSIHEGYTARKIEAHGGVSDRCEMNRKIRRRNAALEDIRFRLAAIQKDIKKILAERKLALRKLLEVVEDDRDVPHEISR